LPFFPNQENPILGTVRWIFICADYGNSVDIIPITKQLKQSTHYQKAVTVLKDTDEGKLMKLEFDSLFVFDRVITLPKTTFISPPCHYKGRCSDSFIQDYF
jgi:hypothetical protein